MQFYNFPEFLRHNAKWAIWRYEKQHGKDKPSKPPRHPHSTELLSVNEPASWASFDECVATVGNGEWWNGIGFLIEKHLGVTVVDLDYRDGRPTDVDTLHRRIFEQLGSYSELSPSGQGLHIVSLGVVPSARNFDVEVYSDQRFMSVTGRAINNVPLIDNQLKLEQLSEALSNANRKIERKKLDHSAPESADDASVVARGYAASNAAKFSALWEGRWQSVGYPSQSEADFALINMLAHYTPNIVQIRRLFFQSALGQRDKLEKRPELLDSMIAAAFDRMLPEVDFSALEAQFKAKMEASETALTVPAKVSPAGVASDAIPPPGGLLGEICKFYYNAAFYPVPEIAISGGIGFMSGLCGSAWNVDGTGLNTFLLLTAPTASGKDILTNGTNRLISACKRDPALYQGTTIFQDALGAMMGPARIASGSALTKSLKTDFSSILSIQSEFGMELQKLTDPRASLGMVQLKEMYLDLAARSGRSAVLGKEIWSDTKENIADRKGISFSLLAESVPNKVYDNLTPDQIQDGFVGRFIVIECESALMDYNRAANQHVPSAELVDYLQRMSAFAGNRMMRGDPVNVEFEPEAAALMEQYRILCRQKHVGRDSDPTNGIWGRSLINAKKLSALCAVGDSFENPVIRVHHVQWATELVNRGVNAVLGRFERGEVGTPDDAHRVELLRKLLSKYAHKQAYCNGKHFKAELHAKGQISKSHLHAIAASTKKFPDRTFDRAYEMLRESGAFVQIADNTKSAWIEFKGTLLQIVISAL